MLDRLPVEIVECILGYLPTLTAISDVSKTNKKLHETVQNGSSSIYHDFVQRQFPTIPAETPWRQTAIDLTTRSRAWDRRALIARECVPPGLFEYQQYRQQVQQQTLDRQTFGYMPVIDSHETTETGRKRELLAWGAAGRLNLRFTDGKVVRWSSYCPMTEPDAEMDIVDVHLMRPHQNRNQDGESMLIRRHNKSMTLLHVSADGVEWDAAAEYQMPFGASVDCIDVSNSEDPLLAMCNESSIRIFEIHDPQDTYIKQIHIPAVDTVPTKQRKRAAKFVSNTRLAVATQHLGGLDPACIEVFDIGESSISTSPLAPADVFESRKQADSRRGGRRIGANVLEKISDASTSSGSDSNLLLSGWSDGLVRLYDMRASSAPVQEYWDPVDDGQIFSLLSIGRERFLAGSHQNGCLKTFDMRMNGRVYDYTEASKTRIKPKTTPAPSRSISTARETNIFLAVTVDPRNRIWRPISDRAQNARLPRYNGSIYSLSSPSATSSSVYVGIENHVIQFDTISSDDWLARRDLIESRENEMLNLSCYERPRRGRESTDSVLLRKQRPLSTIKSDAISEAEPGWDERWFLDQPRSSTKGMAGWRRGQVI